MKRTVYQSNFRIDHRIAGKDPCARSTLDSFPNSWYIFLRYGPSDDLIFKNYTRARFPGFQNNNGVPILAMAPCLLNKFTFCPDLLSRHLLIGNLRSPGFCVNFKFTIKPVNNYFQVELSHAGYQGLPGFGIIADFKRRVLFLQFL